MPPKQSEAEPGARSAEAPIRVGVFTFHADGGVSVGDSWLELLGYARADVPVERYAGAAWLVERVHPDDRAKVGADQRRMFEGAAAAARDFRVQRGDGEWRWVRGAMHREKGVVYGTLTDITSLVEARDAASLSERRFRAIFENVPVMVDSFDEAGRCTLWNRECERCLGYTFEEVRAHPDPLGLFYPDPAVRQSVVDAVIGADGVFREYAVATKSGPRTQRWANLRLPNGETIGVGYDVTEERRLVQALEQSNRDLEEFAYVASHDLQEPLRMVRSYVALLAEELGDDLSDDGREFVRYAVEGAERMQMLVRDLLLYARVQRRELEMAEVDLAALVDVALGDLEATASDARDVVEVGALPTVHGDPKSLERLVTNLLSNALKFRHPDRAARVTIEGERSDAGWRLEVRDNGVGIAPEFQRKVFGMFQRLHSRGEYPGTGIGLAVCQRIAKQHGGSIAVLSELGGGATFVVEVPAGGVAAE